MSILLSFNKYSFDLKAKTIRVVAAAAAAPAASWVIVRTPVWRLDTGKSLTANHKHTHKHTCTNKLTHRHKGKKTLTAANLHNAQGYTLSLLLSPSPSSIPSLRSPCIRCSRIHPVCPVLLAGSSTRCVCKPNNSCQSISWQQPTHTHTHTHTHTPRVTHTHIALGDTLAEQSLMPTIETGRG